MLTLLNKTKSIPKLLFLLLLKILDLIKEMLCVRRFRSGGGGDKRL